MTSIEPGYYEAEQFGIRHENVAVVQNSTKFPDTHLMFDPLTLVPYQRKLINSSLLTSEEIEYIDNYHKRIESSLVDSGLLEDNIELRDWVKKNTQALSSSNIQKLSILISFFIFTMI